MKNIRLLLLLFLSASFALSFNSCIKKGTEELEPFTKLASVEDFKKGIANQGDAAQILDVRSPELYRAGHIPGAINLTATSDNAKDKNGAFTQQVKSLGLNTGIPVYVYGVGGLPAHDYLAPARVSEAGFGKHRTLLLLGGFNKWIDADYEIVTGDNPR